MTSSARTALVLVAFALIAFLSGASAHLSNRRVAAEQQKTRFDESSERLRSILAFLGGPPRKMVEQYKGWVETADFLARPDEDWAVHVLGHAAREIYGVNAVWLFDLSFNEIYSNVYFPPDSEEAPQRLDLSLQSRPRPARPDQEFFHYVQDLNGALYEIWGGIITGEPIDGPQGRPEGFLFVARALDETYFNRVESLFGRPVTILKNSTRADAGATPQVSAAIPLTGKNGQAAARLASVKDSLRPPSGAHFPAFTYAQSHLVVFCAGATLLLFSTLRIAKETGERRALSMELAAAKSNLVNALNERETMVRDMHDNLLQSIYAMGLRTDHALANPDPSRESYLAVLKQQKDALQETIRTIRTFLASSEPGEHADFEIDRALQKLVDSFRSSSSCEFDLALDSKANDRLTTRQKRHLFAIAKELFTNGLRHAHPTKVEGRLKAWRDGVTLEVINDGKPIRPPSLRREGRGLENVRARCEEISAEFHIDSETPKRTRASVFLPTKLEIDA